MKKWMTLILCLFAAFGYLKADNDTPITVNNLPKQSQEFIQKYFPGKEISYAKLEKDLMEKKYEVVFLNGEKVEFDKKGAWTDVDCRFSAVPAEIIPAPIRDYVAKNYPDTKILKIDRDRKDYEVKLNNRLELKFNRNFQLIELDD